MADASECSTTVRRFAGAVADELAILCRPQGASLDSAHQAESVYRTLASVLSGEQASFEHLVSETLFVRSIERDLPLLLRERMRILSGSGPLSGAPPTFIQQAPLGQHEIFELAAAAVVPHRRDEWSARNVQAAPSCTCEGCSHSGARLTRLGEQTALYTTNIYGAGVGAFDQAWDMFCAAERLLDECGMSFRDVVRTWIHLRDINRDYDDLNKARREFFRQRGIEERPASTGVQGAPFPGAHDCCISLHAVKSPRPLRMTAMSTPSLNEAWTYGVDFSRGVRFADANKLTLYVSGTASLDERGQTVHVGNFRAQAERMLDNISTLLAGQGGAFRDLVSGVVYLRDAGDEPVLREICRERGFEGFPCALVATSLCRRDLLCEAEAVAMLPLPAAGA